MPLAVQIILGLLPSFAWLLFYAQEELHPEPKRLLALTFVTGAAFAFIALGVQYGLRHGLTALHITSNSFVWLFLFAATEEIVKFAAAYAALHKNPNFSEPVDAMIYLVVAALGFAAVENVGILLGGNPSSMAFSHVFHLVTFRFIGATLLHTLASGLVGYYWALCIRRFNARRWLAFGLLLASVLHAAFNYGVLHYDKLGFSVALLMIVGFFVLADFEKLKPMMV